MNRHPTLLLAVHGTRQARGTAIAHSLALRVGEITQRPTQLAFADVLTPSVGEVAATVPGPLVVVPAFLASGYHVRTDIPHQLAQAGRADAVITPALGAHPAALATARRRLLAAGYQPGDGVVLACAGTSDARAHTELDQAAAGLSQQLGTRVVRGSIATSTPTVADQVTALRRRGHTRVVVASWLLAPGLFHDRLAHCGADAVAAPLCPDAAIAQALADRYHRAAIVLPV
ncbi:sirohydrochlorin chelatase [Nocardiopsis sp. YSL2]|uniref:sirohydrochlorin chelatase n=1 Tax=Nocardiopsis sp. YSL2 TaxID=2939492 RepID=UPI0026F42285|nr:CbiX/SirB N-terminal domain-containing protein [Nocardiopsis sp. YSL2]